MTRNTGSITVNSDKLPQAIRNLSERGLSVLERVPVNSESDAPGKVYIPILRGLRPLDDAHSDFYESRTREDYFSSSGGGFKGNDPEIYTGLSFYNRLTDLLLGGNLERRQINQYQKFVAHELFEGRDVEIIPSKKNKVVTVKIGKEAEQPIHNLGDGVQSALILSFLPFVTEKPTFFFIEEPESHMHPGLQRKILELFARKKQHTFFLTTHSNHLLDITIDLRETSVFTFQKNVKHDSEDDEQKAIVKIEAVDADSGSSLEQLGVRNSSVFLVNATIWVEGITDRWYLRALLRSFSHYLNQLDPGAFKPEEDAHYSFVEYGGNNITHWSFLESEEHPIEVERLCARAMLVIDQDGDKKLERKKALQENLNDRLIILDCREIENLLPPEIVAQVIASYEGNATESTLSFRYEEYQHKKIGEFIEEVIQKSGNMVRCGGYAADSGTVKSKVDFCDRAVVLLEKFDFEKLPTPAQIVARKIYDFIRENNVN